MRMKLWDRLVGIADQKRPVGGTLDLSQFTIRAKEPSFVSVITLITAAIGNCWSGEAKRL